MDIITGLSAVTETLKITKELRSIDDKLAVADLKLKLADIVDGLLEAKEALQEAKERERELLDQIKALQAAIDAASQLEDDNGFLFRLDERGERIGEPYCNLCYVREGKLYRLRYRPSRSNFPARHTCDNCEKTVRVY